MMFTSYQDCKDFLNGKYKKKLGNNTWLFKINEKSYGIMYHSTFILRYFIGGFVQFDTNGWQTVTTKQRLNKFQPWITISQKNFQWFMHINGDDAIYDYKDRICFDIHTKKFFHEDIMWRNILSLKEVENANYI